MDLRSASSRPRLCKATATFLLLALLGSLWIMPAAAAPRAAPAAKQGAPAAAADTLRVSRSAERKRSIDLEGANLRKKVHVFVTPDGRPSRVRFYLDLAEAALDDPKVSGTPLATDTTAPYDFAGTAANGNANELDTTSLADGPHSITAAIDYPDGTALVVSSRFWVYNTKRKLLFDKNRLKLRLPRSGRVPKALKLSTSDEISTAYTLSENASWLSIEPPAERAPGNGITPAAPTLNVDARGLAPGTHTAMVTASAPAYEPVSLPVTLVVEAAATCAPLACSEIKVALPYQLGFTANHGKIVDANGVGTGFTYVDQPSNATGYIAQNLLLDPAAPGTLRISTTSGIMFSSSNAQDNALAVGVDAPNQVSLIETTLRNPPAGTAGYEQAGLWFGNDEDNHVKLVVISTPRGTELQYLMEVNGVQTASKVASGLNVAGSALRFRLRADPSNRTIAASYSIDGGAFVALASWVAPPEFFSFDAAGIDPAIGTRSFAGIHATHRRATAPLAYIFDDFGVVGEQAPPPAEEISFERVSFPVTKPTALAWGPDGRLYVAEMMGRIHALTLNSAKQVVADQLITTLGSRLTLGMTVDPQSTPQNVSLWVSHSNPSANSGEFNSGTISRLAGTGFARQDVITGLPRAIANHSVNGIHFGPDGKLYIAAGGNTGAGSANSAASEFGTRAEQPLSAALLVADVRAAGFDGSCATPELTFAPAPCDVVPYATGLRNTYDFVWHSNGSLYGPDNGLGVTGTYPPSATAPCTEFGNPASWAQGGHNPGEQADVLNRIEQGKYYGHPNPYRNECVYKSGSYQGVTAPINYVAPFFNLGLNRSANGSIEYRSDTLNGALKGEILIANYSVGDDITRIKLAPDGRSVLAAKQLVGGLNNPLPLVEGSDGTIYVGEHGRDVVTALIPRPNGAWSTKQSMPVELLDAGGAALNGKLYTVAGKTSAGPRTTLYVYDPAAGSWAAGPSLPSGYPAVENPAVVAYNNKLYSFGGSTSPFSGAVAAAAVFDPATSTWAPLPPMQTARGGAVAQVLNGKLYVAGGLDGAGASLASVEVYDPLANSWSAAAAMVTRRDNPGSAVLGGKLYTFGGRTRNADGTEANGTLATVEMYDPSTNTWTARASMPTGRRTMVVGTLNGRAQVMGGERTSSGGAFAQNEEYDPLSNSWRALTPMRTPRHGAAAGTIDGVVYVAGGGVVAGSSFSSVSEAFSFGTATPPPATPETIIDAGPAALANTGSASFSFGSTTAGATFECSLDSGALVGCSSPQQYTGLADGAHTFQVRAVYPAGNPDPSPASRSWTVDTAAPAVTGVAPASAAVNVAVASNVTATFGEAIDPATLTPASFSLVRQGTTTPLAAAVTYDAASRTATLDPQAELLAGASYTASVKGGSGGVKDPAGNALAADRNWSFTTAAGVATGGLTGQYFNNQDLTGLQLTRVDPTVNFAWGNGTPDPSIAADTFSVRWTGRVKADNSQTYTFYTTSNDGVRVWVNNRQVINNWTNHGATENRGTIALQAGQWYSIRVEYYENVGTSVINLSYSSPSTSKRIIPADHLSPTP